jgi:hypothetical protein
VACSNAARHQAHHHRKDGGLGHRQAASSDRQTQERTLISNYAARALTSDFLKAPFDLRIRHDRKQYVATILGRFHADNVRALADDQLMPFLIALAAFYDHDKSIDYGRHE